MSHWFRLLRGIERSWANRLGRSQKMSEWVNCSFANFWAKNERFAWKTMSKFPALNIWCWAGGISSASLFIYSIGGKVLPVVWTPCDAVTWKKYCVPSSYKIGLNCTKTNLIYPFLYSFKTGKDLHIYLFEDKAISLFLNCKMAWMQFDMRLVQDLFYTKSLCPTVWWICGQLHSCTASLNSQ